MKYSLCFTHMQVKREQSLVDLEQYSKQRKLVVGNSYLLQLGLRLLKDHVHVHGVDFWRLYCCCSKLRAIASVILVWFQRFAFYIQDEH